MALVTRTITNAGAPLHSPEGDLLVGVKIHFQLMDTGGRPSDAWDAVSNERVGGETVVATTDAAGEFTVDLWPNTRGNRTTKYKCRVQFEGFREFSGIVEDVPGELQWPPPPRRMWPKPWRALRSKTPATRLGTR